MFQDYENAIFEADLGLYEQSTVANVELTTIDKVTTNIQDLRKPKESAYKYDIEALKKLAKLVKEVCDNQIRKRRLHVVDPRLL